MIIAIYTQQAVAIIATCGTPPTPTLGISKTKVVVNNTSYIEGCLHRKVVTTSSTNLFVIAHNTDLCLPKLYALFFTCLTYLHTTLAHIVEWRSCPIAVATNESGQILYIAYIGIGAILREQCLYLISTLPVGFMCAKHTAIVARFVDKYLRLQLLLRKSLTQLTCHMSHLTISSGRAFLLRTKPVPMSIRLITRTDIVDMHTVMLLDTLN